MLLRRFPVWDCSFVLALLTRAPIFTHSHDLRFHGCCFLRWVPPQVRGFQILAKWWLATLKCSSNARGFEAYRRGMQLHKETVASRLEGQYTLCVAGYSCRGSQSEAYIEAKVCTRTPKPRYQGWGLSRWKVTPGSDRDYLKQIGVEACIGYPECLTLCGS